MQENLLFLNTLIGEKISITSNIPQTTRKKVLAIYNDSDSQVIFFDTPGIHFDEKSFNKAINGQAISSLSESDLILYFIDSSRNYGDEEKYIAEILENVSAPIFKVYTKTDLKARIAIPQNKNNVFEISSNKVEGFEPLLENIKEKLPTSTLLFPENIYTKQDMFFRISEIIREKVFTNTKEEIPHSIFISVDEIEEEKTKDGKDLLKIVAYINAESDSQKYILIGKGGKLIAKMGKESRIEIEQIFGKKTFLALRVKVRKNWRKDERLIKEILK
ncbi:MAG: GTPase Era [Candidatus Gracilibacteria bacterium]|nr:GTPase Era [Candidatus Gracilibacteria bacterium]